VHCHPTYASHVARIKGTFHQTLLLLVEIGSGGFFAWAGLKLQSFPTLASPSPCFSHKFLCNGK
jgi:hypothetical protein